MKLITVCLISATVSTMATLFGVRLINWFLGANGTFPAESIAFAAGVFMFLIILLGILPEGRDHSEHRI